MEDWLTLVKPILPIRNITITLQFIDQSAPRFFHQLEINALLRYWVDNDEDFEQFFRIDCPESGQSQYKSGDYYRFTLFALGHSDRLLQQLLRQLQALPSSAPVTDGRVPFRNNLKLISLQDGFTERPFTSTLELSQYDIDTLNQEVDLWRNIDRLRFRWISPARLLKDKRKR